MKTRTFTALLAVLGLAGCGTPGVWITKKPSFDYRKIKVLAVLPSENSSEYPGANRIVSDKLTSLLVQNGSYTILSRGDLKGLIPEGDLPEGGKVTPAGAMEIGHLTGADALLTGRVERYDCGLTQETRYETMPIWGTWDDFDAIPDSYDSPYDYYMIDAEVSVSVTLTDTSNGTVLWTDSRKASYHTSGSPPPESRSEALGEASDTAMKQLYLGLVVHQEKERVPPGSLFTCSEYIDHPIDERTRFTASDRAVFVVIDLNSGFVDKKVLLNVEKGEGGKLVASFEYTWDNTGDTHAFTLPTKDLIKKGGYGKYRATYSMDGRRIGRTDFSLSED